MKCKNISLIIPTYKREKQIIKILKSLKNQVVKNLKLEIIICDSFSNYNKRLFPSSSKNFKIKYFNIIKNNLSAKRNYGINKAKYKNIILIDDDCIPDKYFLSTYVKDFLKIDNRSILSGVVDYPKAYIKKFNHINFRNQKHFKRQNRDLSEINPDKIVAMNLGFINSKKMSNIKYFDERFTGYGFEDHEFGYRYYKNGFKLITSNARIIHDEGKPNINNYIKKHYHLGKDGMKNLLKINKSLAKTTVYNKIEQNFFYKLIIKLPKLNCFLLFFEKLIISTDKSYYMNFLFLYNLLRLSSYSRGLIARNNHKLKNKNYNWYE